MSLLTLLTILSGVFGLGKDLSDIITNMHKQGIKPGDLIPEEHLLAIHAAFEKAGVPPPNTLDWDANHEGSGGG